MLIFPEEFHLSTIRLCPHLEVLLTHGQFRLCSTGTHSHQSAQAFYQSLQGIEAFHQNAKEKFSTQKKMVVNDTDSEASFLVGFESH